MGIKDIYNDKCNLCPLGDFANMVCARARGVKNPRVLVVGDAPSREEDAIYTSFDDQRTKLLLQAMKEVGFDKGEFTFTYAAKCYPHGKLQTQVVKVCSEEYLHREIELLKPKLIITLGKNSQVAVLRNSKPLSKTHGKMFEYFVEKEVIDPKTSKPLKKKERVYTDIKVVPIEHPFAVLSSPEKYDGWVSDLKRAKSVLTGGGDPYFSPDKLERFNFVTLTSKKEVEEAITYLIDNFSGFPLAFDTETSGLDNVMFQPDFKMYSIQFGVIDLDNPRANTEYPVYIIPFMSENFDCCQEEGWQQFVVEQLEDLFDLNFIYVAHNLKYDLKVLRRFGVSALGDWDTVTLWANLHGEAPLSLKEIAYQVSDLGGYERIMDEYFEEHKTYDAPPYILIPYGGLDIVVVRYLFYELNKTILQKKRA